MISLNRFVIILIVGIFVSGILTISLISNSYVDANSTKKINFTKTIISSQDPGQGHENHQLSLILSPNEGTLYDGSLTFTSNEPVDVVVLHEITGNDVKGQPTWTIDGKTIYAMSLIDLKSKSDSFEFTGAALALHSSNSEEFIATVSVDGWIRGQPTEVIMQKIQVEKDPSLMLSRANVEATIPMHEGLYKGNSIFYIITDTSRENYSKKITEKQDWKVQTSPLIEKMPEEILQKIFIFNNGVRGQGIYGHQKEIFSSTPIQESKYSALHSVIEVSWKKGQNAKVLESFEDVINAEKDGRIEFIKTGVIINSPQIIWPNGQMLVRNDTKITDDLTFSGGQITKINKDEMTVTFVAHRMWGPDGKTIYSIVTDATPSSPSEIMGIPFSPVYDNLITNSSAADLFQFQNGIKGSGSLGYQPGITSVNSEQENYSPLWRIYNVEWHNPKDAKILQTISDIDSFKAKDLISVSLARPMNSHHIINGPLIDPFQ